MRKANHAIIFFLAAFLFVSCTKFENGPTLSLRTVKGRLVGEWQIVDFEGPNAEDYLNEIEDGYVWFFEFDKDGDGSFGYIDDGYIYSYNMDWELDGNELQMDIFGGGGQVRTEWEIQRLTNDELELKSESLTPGLVWIFEKD